MVGRCRRQVADVGEDDLRALAAELERDRLDVGLADRPQERPADLGRAGERDLVDRRMARQGVADDPAGTGHDVEDAVGQAGFGRQLGEAQGAQRRLAGRLEDDRVAGGERRAELPGGDDQRVVPGHDRGDHADRLAGDERQRIGPGRADLAVDLVDRLGVPLERRGGARNVHPERVADRLADVERFEQGELLEVLADELRQAEQDPLPGGRRLVRPATIVERSPGCRHRPVDILDAALGDGRDPRSVTTGDVVERPARRRRHEPAVDEQLGPRRDRGGPGDPVGGGGRPRVRRWSCRVPAHGRFVEDDARDPARTGRAGSRRDPAGRARRA